MINKIVLNCILALIDIFIIKLVNMILNKIQLNEKRLLINRLI